MYITNKNHVKLLLKIAIFSLGLFMITLNLHVSLKHSLTSDFSLFGLNNIFPQDALAYLECCQATATWCGKKCYVTSACYDCVCYGGGESASCWCLDYPPEVYVTHCSDNGGSCPPDDPGCELIRD